MKRREDKKRREIVWSLRYAFGGNFKVVGRYVLWKIFNENMLLFCNGVND